MEICVSAFVGATEEQIDGALLYLKNLGTTSPAIIARYAEIIAPLRPCPLPILGASGSNGGSVTIHDVGDKPRVGKRVRPIFKPEGLTIAKYFRQADGKDHLYFGHVADIPPFSATNRETKIYQCFDASESV